MLDHSPRVALAAAVAELNDKVLAAAMTDDDASALAVDVQRLSASIPTADDVDEAGATSIRWRDYRRRSPFGGTENPRAPGLVMKLDPAADDRSVAVGSVVLTDAFAGAPGISHGGVLAGLFDEAIGWIASAASPDQAVVTAKLAIRYRQPTPVGETLHFRAAVERQTSRRLTVTAICTCRGTETASAEALMVAAPRTRVAAP